MAPRAAPLPRAGLAGVDMARAELAASRAGIGIDAQLYVHHGQSRRAIAAERAELFETRLIDPVREPPAPQLVVRYGPEAALRDGVLPWRRIGGCVVVLVIRPERFLTYRARLEELFGDVRMALTTEDQLHRAVARGFATTLCRAAEQRLPAAESSRNWDAARAGKWGAAVLAAVALAGIVTPAATFIALTALVCTFLFAGSVLKLAAAIAALRGPPDPPGEPVALVRLPVITLLIPLFKEREIADHLLSRLEALDYPRELLDVCLVLESGDDTTRAALGRTRLLNWMRCITVPEGAIRTKPRALNYALNFARGSIVGVYDAEDAPAPDQLRRVAETFAQHGPDVACLQGRLDYYNARANWMTRCFTLEYAAWFRVVLPGFARMGLVVPLGGTTLFFRRDALEALGGWDAYNVTEDADLGVRLARHGFRTAFLDSVTEEEANGRLWPWIKQRARWLKGYAITYGVHMRRPGTLWRDLGPWRFFGLQLLFLGTLMQFLMAPLLWSFWLVPLGLPHPVADAAPRPVFWALVGLFLATEAINLVIAALGARRAGKTWLIPWAPTMQLYYPLAALGAWKGVLELAWRPFFWDKTAHGVLMGSAIPPPPTTPRPASGA